MKKVFYVAITILSFLILSSCSTESTPTYTLSVTAEPAEAGTVSPASGEYEEGEQVEVSATANEHWLFTGWQGDHSGSASPTTITMDADKVIRAMFTNQEYPLTIETEGEGTVEEEVIQSKTTDYEHGTAVELTAVPSDGWAFIRWEGDRESQENPLVITVEEETTITAVFERVEYPLTVSIEGEGEVFEQVVQSKTTDYPGGTVVELTGVPDENWAFSKWSGDLDGEENPATITIDEAREVTATFLRSYTLTMNASPEEGGTVTPESGGYVQDTTIEVEAEANEGWEFAEWEGDFSGSVNPFNLTMNGSKTIVAKFERIDYPLTITIEGEGTVEEEVVQSKTTEYPYETTVQLTPTPSDGWMFSEWSGDLSGSDVPELITIDEQKNVTVRFEQIAFLAENGITIMCPNAEVGDIGIVDGVEYEVVDRNLLEQRRDERADLARVCTSLVNDMSEMIYDIAYFNQDIGSWDVSNVTNMSRMFGMSDWFNQDIGSWDVSKVTDMSGMFAGSIIDAHYHFNQDISGWNVSNVTNMRRMFTGAVSFNQDIGNWDVSNVTDMSGMFDDAQSFNQNIENWDVSSVTDMSKMFMGSSFNQPIGDWDVSSVTDMSGMFGMGDLPSYFNQPIGEWDVSSVTNMANMFSEAYAFNQDIGYDPDSEEGWVVSSVTDMSGMFAFAGAFDQDISGWNVSNVTDMRRMFSSARNFNQNLSGWCVETITSKPNQFDDDTPQWLLPKPVWGTCPTNSTWPKDTTTEVVEVTNPVTGRIWMDRNLGASRVATSSTDTEAYGDLYQWGRAADGHEKRDSDTIDNLSNIDQPGHGDFILSPDSPNDWRNPQNDNLWQGISGINNPCPSGYRVPTEAEWEEERQSWSSNDASGAFASPLKLTVAGRKSRLNGDLNGVDTYGRYWTNTVSESNSMVLRLESNDINWFSNPRAGAFSVRCIKD